VMWALSMLSPRIGMMASANFSASWRPSLNMLQSCCGSCWVSLVKFDVSNVF
jgi:hypothetical protein